MRIFAILVFIIGFIVEFYSVGLLLKGFIFKALISHIIASGLIAYGTQAYLTPFFKNTSLYFYLFIFLLAFFLPVGGIIIGLFVIFSLYRLRTKYYRHAEILENVINVHELKPVKANYGPGGAVRKLMDSEHNTVERTDALLALGTEQFVSTSKMMQALLDDDSDEIRLLAFKTIEQQEKAISDRIESIYLKLNEKDSETLDSISRATHEKNLTQLYWELIYENLVASELQESILTKAQGHALSALKTLPEDAYLWLLLGKIYVKRNEPSKAGKAFDRALSLNIPASNVLPYLAEIKFKEKDYVVTREYLNYEVLQDIPLVAAVKKFWDRT